MSISNDNHSTLKKNKKRVIEILKTTNPFSQDVYDKIMTSATFPNLKEYIEKELIEQGFSRFEIENQEVAEIIAASMTEFLRSYPAPSTYRNILKIKFSNWLTKITTDLQLEETPIIRYNPLSTDTLITIITSLHNRQGITKKELQTKTGLSGKQVMNYLAAINVDDDPRTEVQEAKVCNRIAGQEIKVKIKDIQGARNQKSFFTPETLNPIFLQTSVYQTAVLLNALYESYGDDICSVGYMMAADIWCQLSEYTRERIQNHVFPDNPNFHSFIDDIQAETFGYELIFSSVNTDSDFDEDNYYENQSDDDNSRTCAFISEPDLLNDIPGLSLKDQINIAAKSGEPHDVTISLNGQKRTYEKVILSFENIKDDKWGLVLTGNSVPTGKIEIKNEIISIKQHKNNTQSQSPKSQK